MQELEKKKTPLTLEWCYLVVLRNVWKVFNLFWLPIGPGYIVSQGNSLSAVSGSISLGSTLWDDWQTEHGKFLNCTLFVNSGVHVHKT